MVIIMISGKQGSGKSRLAKDLNAYLSGERQAVYRTRFAKVLYEMHNNIVEIGRGYGINIPDKNGTLLQFIGTEWMRNTIDEDAWVKCVEKDLVYAKNCGNDFVIIDDLRFHNEFWTLVPTADDRVVRIRLEAGKECRKARCDSWRDDDNHPSEIGLDDYVDDRLFDLILNSEVHGPEKILNCIIQHLQDLGHLPLK